MKQQKRSAVVGAILPPATIFLFVLFLRHFSEDAAMDNLLRIRQANAPTCKRVLVFTSQRHGSNALMERINNCNLEKGSQYERTFEFPEYSLGRIRDLQLTAYGSFYEYFKTIPKYHYKIMSDVFYQMYYHVDNFVTHLKDEEEEPFTYVLLKRNNTVEVFYSHVHHLRKFRSQGNSESEGPVTIGEAVVQGNKKETFNFPKWSFHDYQAYKNYIHYFYEDVRAFMRQKRLPLDELFYEDVVLNPPLSEEGKKVYLPARNCVLKLCHRGSSESLYSSERG